MRRLWEKTNLNWVWTWMAVYSCSLSMLAAYAASAVTAAATRAWTESHGVERPATSH